MSDVDEDVSENGYAPVPTDRGSDMILLSFLIWACLALPINMLTCSVERYPVPPMESITNQVSVWFFLLVSWEIAMRVC